MAETGGRISRERGGVAVKGERRRIWLLDGSVAVTGALVSAREMARAIQQEADIVLVLPHDAKISELEVGDFLAVHRLPIRPLRRNLRDVLLYLPLLSLAVFRLRLLMRRDGAEILLVNDFYLLQGALQRLLGFRGRILTWVRIDPAAFGVIARVWLWCAARASDQVIAVSQHICSLLPQNMRSTLLYDPVSAEFLADPEPLMTTEKKFVFVGNYIQGKGQDVALEALAQVIKVCPDARLQFYGGDMGLEKNRTYRRLLEEQVESLGLSHAVTFGGFESSPRAVLSGKLASLNLSKSESFSRTVLEASACGLPVIATRCGGPEEIVQDGETGFLIPIGDVGRCAEAMLELCETPGLAQRMGQEGREQVILKFSPKLFRSRLLACIGQAARWSDMSAD